jgi:hypothetical protein
MDKLMKQEPILYYISFIYSHLNIKESYNRHIDKFSQESKENLFDFEFIQYEIEELISFVIKRKFVFNIIYDDSKVNCVLP